MKPYLVGIDMGGTFIKTAILNREGEIIAKVEIPSEKEKGPDGVIANMCQSVVLVTEKENINIDKVAAIGIGSPGPLNTKKGIVRNAVNLPGWIDIPLRERISSEFNIPANLENDANAAAYGEYWRGAGEKSKIMIAYTLGTGVGGGIIINGHLVRGTSDGAGELGHVTVVPEGDLCACGNNGCVEAYASATALVRRTKQKLEKGADSILNQWISEGKQLTSKLIDDARRLGDDFATEAIRELGYYLGIGVSSAVSMLNPDAIVLGGGMMKAGQVIIDPVWEQIRRRVFKAIWESLEVVPAKLGNDAGVTGAAGLILERGVA